MGNLQACGAKSTAHAQDPVASSIRDAVAKESAKLGGAYVYARQETATLMFARDALTSVFFRLDMAILFF